MTDHNDPDPLGLVRAINRLMREMPDWRASDEVHAAWFDHKADVFEQIAAENPWQTAEATELAATARAKARQLRKDGSR